MGLTFPRKYLPPLALLSDSETHSSSQPRALGLEAFLAGFSALLAGLGRDRDKLTGVWGCETLGILVPVEFEFEIGLHNSRARILSNPYVWFPGTVYSRVTKLEHFYFINLEPYIVYSKFGANLFMLPCNLLRVFLG